MRSMSKTSLAMTRPIPHHPTHFSGVIGLRSISPADIFKSQGLETYFNMHKYTELLTYLTKIRISDYKHICLYSEILIFVRNVNNLVYLCILKYVSSPCALNNSNPYPHYFPSYTRSICV